ncbi:MAG: hypothetical protein IJH67_08195 [Thermoguttaceae bacterium]|nr:hypothetical protein [Thermoguttaceae bacterium]
MKKEKLPDGFPVEQPDAPSKNYPCDNCGKIGESKNYISIEGETETDLHRYDFCSEECMDEFARDNGLTIEKDDYGLDIFVLAVDCDAELQPEDVNPETKPEDERSEEAPTELNEVEMFAEEKPTCYEKKATECWKHVVKTAQEISAAASKIVILQDQLKDAKKEYDALVNRQNSYILNNGDSIQTTFADMDSVPEPTITEDSEPAEPDNSWRSLPCDGKLPVKLTDKQWDAVRSAFPTLGDLQDWLSRDRREKIPGVSQTVYDKLVDALNNYVAVWQQEHNADKQTTEENDNV